ILIIVMIFERIFQPNWILAAYMCAHFLLAAVHTLCSHIIICSERSDQKREQELQLQKRTQAEIEERHWEECMVSIVRKELGKWFAVVIASLCLLYPTSPFLPLFSRPRGDRRRLSI